MAVFFKPEDHSYHSSDPEEIIDWIGVTTLVSLFKEPFDPKKQSKKSSVNPNSKWFGMSEKDIQEAWKSESTRAVDLGTWYHNQREADVLSCETIERNGVELKVFKPKIVDGVKHAPEQRLINGIYPEHFIYLKSVGICGQSDRVEIVNEFVNVRDYKTNKKIDKNSYYGFRGPKMMLSPLNHLEDCNFNHYAIQLSIYAYAILRHNPTYTCGDLVIDHVIFEESGQDKYGNRIIALDSADEPIVKDVIPYQVPYLKNEVITLIDYVKENREEIKSKIFKKKKLEKSN